MFPESEVLEKTGEKEVFRIDQWQERPVYRVPPWAEEFPEDWRDDTVEYSEHDYDITDAMGRILSSYSGDQVLEIGGGHHTGLAALIGDENQVVQTDYDMDQLELLRRKKNVLGERYGKDIESDIVAADARDLPFRDSEFDLVFGKGVFDYERKDENNMVHYSETDVERVLADGGDVIIVEDWFEHYGSAEEVLEEMGMTYINDGRFGSVELDENVLYLQDFGTGVAH